MGVCYTEGVPLTKKEMARLTATLKRWTQLQLFTFIGVKKTPIFHNAIRGRPITEYA